VLVVVLGLVVTALAVGALVTWWAVMAARRDADRVTADLRDARIADVHDDVVQLDRHLELARWGISGPHWALVQALPWYGDDVRAVRLVVTAGSQLARGTGLPLSEVALEVDRSSVLRNGAPDLRALNAFAPRVERAAANADRASDPVTAIDASGVTGSLRQPVVSAIDAITRAAQASRSGADLLAVSRSLVEGRAPVLLAVQNPAEARGSGGVISAWGLLDLRSGRPRLIQAGVSDQLAPHPALPSDVPADALGTYGPAQRGIRHVNDSSDFPTGARLLLSSYRQFARATSRPVPPANTPVVAITPRGLAAFLKATGPVPLPYGLGKVDAATANALFTRGIYGTLPGRTQPSLVIRAALSGVLLRLGSRDVDPASSLRALSTATSRGDLLAWSAQRPVEEALDRLGATGRLGAPDRGRLVLGLVSGDGSKLDYYLRERVTLDRRAAVLTMVSTNTAPARVPTTVGAATSGGSPASTHALTLQLHVPPGVAVVTARVDGRPVEPLTGTEGGWSVVRVPITVPAGKSVPVALELDGDVLGLQDVSLPTMTSDPQLVVR
jgi:hypothetical protein